MYKITEVNAIKTYNMSAGKTLPQFLEEAKKTHKSLRYNEEYKRRIELIQDFQFEIATSQVEISRDQRYIVAAGIYAPQIKIYDTAELSLKCLRGVDSEVVRFKILSDDYSKIVMAQQDRSITFHAQYGCHYKTRIPHYPRDLEYNPLNANLCVSASANEVYRISLQQGKFLSSFHTDGIINSLSYNPHLNIMACGGDAGVEIWDFRERNKICSLGTEANKEVTYVQCDPTGLLLGVGVKGEVNVFDFRFDRKLYKIKSSYNEPINSIHFTEDINKSVLVSNKKQIKVTQNEGDFFTSVEPDSSINMFSVAKGTGMILAALQDPKIGCYFIPQLGCAPKWVPYIENITEELQEENKKIVYDEYKFVTKQEVFELGCTNLIGTRMLKEYMHGYLMHLKLYNKFQEKLDRINYSKAGGKKIEDDVDKQAPVRVEVKEVIEDSRFAMKDNREFEVDKHSEAYILRHPHMKKQLLKEKKEEEERLERIMRVNKKKIQKPKKKDDGAAKKKRYADRDDRD